MTSRGAEGRTPSAPLRLDLLRHGAASPAGPDGDSVRPLSPAGRDAIERLAARFAREGWRPEALWSSPLERARETAAILAGACPGLEIGILEALAPESEPAQVIADLVTRGATRHVVLVGHQPLLGRLVAYLTGASERGVPAGGLVRLAFPGALARGSATLEMELRPEST